MNRRKLISIGPASSGGVWDDPLRPRVLVLSRGFPPGFRTGGPARSVSALTDTLGHVFSFFVITSAFDFGQRSQLENVKADQWVSFRNANVFYSTSRLTAVEALRFSRTTKVDLLYLNSVFSIRYSLFPCMLFRSLRRDVPILIAPRGELSSGAQRRHALRKKAFLAFFSAMRLQRSVSWHASTSLEADEVQATFSRSAQLGRIFTAMNLSPAPSKDLQRDDNRFSTSELHIAFFSRIDHKKNLLGLLEALHLVEAPVKLRVAGPVADDAYWLACQHAIEALPSRHSATYVGEIDGNSALEFLSKQSLFVLPTFGENFGHAIFEALAAGTPVVVGSETPWASVESSGAGWTCDATSAESIASAITDFLAMRPAKRAAMGTAAFELAQSLRDDQSAIQANLSMFQALTGGFRGAR